MSIEAERRTKVYRLVAKETGKYAVNTAECMSVEEGNEIAMRWWKLEDTLSIVVMDRNREDARYAHTDIDESRLPEQWPRPEPKAAALGPSQDAGALLPPAPPPTLFNRSQRSQELQEGHCPCCFQKRTQPDPADDDPTPTGRINNLLCPECGQLVPVANGGPIYQMYMKYQERLSVAHAAVPKPWHRG